MGTDDGKIYSVELCGGTHARRLGDIGLFKITGESAVSAGVRRIEALTGAGALSFLNEQHKLIREAAGIMRAPPAELAERIVQLMDERKKLERELSEARRQIAMGGSGSAPGESAEIAGIRVMARIVEGVEPKDLRTLADQAKQKIGSGVIAFATASDGKAAFVVGVTQDLTSRFNAVELLKRAVEAVGGKGGGGRPDMAQGGGPDGTRLQGALDSILAAIKAAA